MSQLKVITFLLMASFGLTTAYTEAPIIGVLTQEATIMDQYFPGENYTSYIAASYVKFLESAGARVVPIWIGRDEAYYRGIVEKTNGLLWPGGSPSTVPFNTTGGYGEAGKILYKLALEKNSNGIYYPLWAVCLGMELLADIIINDTETRVHCSAKNIPMPLEFKPDYKQSKLFAEASDEFLEILSTQNVTYNNHEYCVPESMLTMSENAENWHILSTNNDTNGLKFLSLFESKIYPFYGLQFHPEKNLFEFKRDLKIPHFKEAVEASTYFAKFFVEECRKNSHMFEDWHSEQLALIYNYEAKFVGVKNSSFQQAYLFKQ